MSVLPKPVTGHHTIVLITTIFTTMPARPVACVGCQAAGIADLVHTSKDAL